MEKDEKEKAADGVVDITLKTASKKVERDEKAADGGAAQAECRCGTCMKPFSSGEGSAQCELCDIWFHSKCQGISESMFRAMKDYGELHWFCKGCRGGAEKLLAMVSKMQTKVERIEEELLRLHAESRAELTQAVNDVKAELAVIAARVDRVEKQTDESINNVQKMEPKWSELFSKQVENKISLATADLATVQTELKQQTQLALQESREELEEIARRRGNIIVHGLAEPVGTTPEERKSQDSDKVNFLLQELGADVPEVKGIIRLGKRSDVAGVPPRPVKLVLVSEEQKDKVLRKAKNLKNMGDKGLDKVFLHQDLTPRQRETRQCLVREMKERQARGEQNLAIVNGKVIVRKMRVAQN